MKNNTNYFSHDCNARNDERLMKIRAAFDRKWYWMYFAIIEMLSEASWYKLSIDTLQVITKLYQIDNDVITMLFDLLLLVKDEKFFWSESLLLRMSLKDSKQEKYSKAGIAGMKKRWWGKENTSSSLVSNNNVITSKVKESKVKESKVKEIKEINIPFISFRDLYNKKTWDKKACERKWNKLKDTEREKIINTLPKYLLHKPFAKYTHPNPATYLNQRRRENDIVEKVKTFEEYEIEFHSSRSWFREKYWEEKYWEIKEQRLTNSLK